jgi:hypothetical protein
MASNKPVLNAKISMIFFALPRWGQVPRVASMYTW